MTTIRLTRIDITPMGDQDGPAHLGAAYQVVYEGGRMLQERALTLAGPASPDRTLPAELILALETLWAYAEDTVRGHEGA